MMEGGSRNIYLIPVMVLAAFGVFHFLLNPGDSIKSHIKAQENKPMILQQENQDSRCISLSLDEDVDTSETSMEKLISKHKQIVVLAEPKASGSSLVAFSKKCMAEISPWFEDNWNMRVTEKFLSAFQSEYEIPPVIAFHMAESDRLCDLMKGATDDTLIVFSHRQETDRMDSALRHVLSKRYCGMEKGKREGVLLHDDGSCAIQESVVWQAIEKQDFEIGTSNTHLFSCELYDCLKDNNPTIVLMNFKHASEMQKILGKNYCPNFHDDIQTNTADGHRDVTVVLEGGSKNGTIVSSSEWVAQKLPFIEYSFQLKKDISCQATTRKMERELLACPDQTYQISGESYSGLTMDFPF